MTRDAYHMLPVTHGLIKVQRVGEDMPSNMPLLSTLNRWSFTEHTSWLSKPRLPKFPPKRLMSLDHKPKMRLCTSGFVVILCKYGLLLKKSFAMSVREVIWAVSFDLLLKPHPYVDVDDVMRLWSQLMKRKCGHEFAPWNKYLAGHVSLIHVVE